MEATQKMIPVGKGKRIGIKLDEPTWRAVEWLAEQAGQTWQQWCAQVIQEAGEDSNNMTAVVRAAAMDRLLSETILADRADQMTSPQAIAMRMAGQCDDGVFREDLQQSTVESKSDCGGFTLRTGIDMYGRICYWIENGLRGGTHIIVRTPFTPEQWEIEIKAIGADE